MKLCTCKCTCIFPSIFNLRGHWRLKTEKKVQKRVIKKRRKRMGNGKKGKNQRVMKVKRKTNSK